MNQQQTNLRTDMSARWQRFLQRGRLADSGGRVLQRLLTDYESADRHYHGLRHIQHCLTQLDSVRDITPDPLAVEAALWFHDIVYDPRRNDNEQQSAEVAAELLSPMGMNNAGIEMVKELILDTRHENPPASADGQFVVDIDLSGLAQAPEGFDDDGRAIRTEYAHVDEASFREGRADFFERFLARPSIYFTLFFRQRCEAQARQNLSRALRRLRVA